MLAVFIALLQLAGLIWLIRELIYVVLGVHAVLWGLLLTTAAHVVGKRYTILAIGIINTIIGVFIAPAFGGPLAALCYLTPAVVLETVLYFSAVYGADPKVDAVGCALYGFVERITLYGVLIFIYGYYLPDWLVWPAILICTGLFPVGSYLGYRLGKKVKVVVESV